MESGDVDNYFMLDMAGAPEEGEEELEQPQEGQDAEAEADLGWAVDTAADTRDVAADIGDTDFEEYAADLEAQAQLQMEAEVDAQAELALAEEDARAQELAQEAAAVAAAFGVEDEVPNFAMEFAPENGTPVHMQQEALDFEAAGEAELGEEEAPEQAGTEEVAEADAEMQEDEADRADEAGDSAAVSLQPSRKRSRDAAFAEAQELLATVTPAALLGKLRRLDPVAGIDEYYLVDGELEGQALAEDFQLTRDFYSAQALENSLVSMRAAVQRVQSRVKIPENSSIIEVLPGRIFLGDATAARNIPAILQHKIQKVINCSPQTVRDTGQGFYGPGVEYLELWHDDFEDYCILCDFDVAWSFAYSDDSSGPVLIHCEAGVNRSCALAIAMRMRILLETSQTSDPEMLFKSSWCHVAARKQRVLTTTGFQRQLLLFARMGCCWFPTLDAVWRTVQERHMAQFRALAEDTAKTIVCANSDFPPGTWWRAIVFIRDATMRGEKKIEGGYDLSTDSKRNIAENRVRGYATSAMPKLVAAAKAGPTPAASTTSG